MRSVTVQQAQAELAKLIESLQPGEELVITLDNQPIAKLVRQKRQRQFGLGKGKLTVIQEDDEHLQDFREYMP